MNGLVSDGEWYVLIEESEKSQLDSDAGWATVHRWWPAESKHARHGRESAQALAEEQALGYLPKELMAKPGTPGRRVFKLPGDCWLVEVRAGYTTRHFRVSVAELVHEQQEVVPPAPPAPAPAPGLLKRTFGRG